MIHSKFDHVKYSKAFLDEWHEIVECVLIPSFIVCQPLDTLCTKNEDLCICIVDPLQKKLTKEEVRMLMLVEIMVVWSSDTYTFLKSW